MRQAILSLLSAGLLVLLVALAAGVWIKQFSTNQLELPNQQSFILKRGTSIQAMTNQLADYTNHKPELGWYILARWSALDNNFQAGEYEFSANMSPNQILAKIASGKVVKRSITFAEGLSVKQIIHILQNTENLTDKIDAQGIIEGSLMPDTYQYVRGESRNAIIKRMQQSMSRYLEGAWKAKQANLPFKNINEALILASIVEKETGVNGERRKVAAVFVNRLRIKMPLQSDPTIIYGITKGTPLGRGILRKEINTATAYNTYTIPALPPTAIANPGKAAIEATLNPAKTKDLYFVATGNGGHKFATNLKDHNNNVLAYRRAMRSKS